MIDVNCTVQKPRMKWRELPTTSIYRMNLMCLARFASPRWRTKHNSLILFIAHTFWMKFRSSSGTLALLVPPGTHNFVPVRRCRWWCWCAFGRMLTQSDAVVSVNWKIIQTKPSRKLCGIQSKLAPSFCVRMRCVRVHVCRRGNTHIRRENSYSVSDVRRRASCFCLFFYPSYL